MQIFAITLGVERALYAYKTFLPLDTVLQYDHTLWHSHCHYDWLLDPQQIISFPNVWIWFKVTWIWFKETWMYKTPMLQLELTVEKVGSSNMVVNLALSPIYTSGQTTDFITKPTGNYDRALMVVHCGNRLSNILRRDTKNKTCVRYAGLLA